MATAEPKSRGGILKLTHYRLEDDHQPRISWPLLRALLDRFPQNIIYAINQWSTQTYRMRTKRFFDDAQSLMQFLFDELIRGCSIERWHWSLTDASAPPPPS